MNRKLWILIIVVIVILGIIFIPKILKNEGDQAVKFEILNKNEVPKKIQELLPRYMSEERALACKIENEVYVIVTRGEKKTAGYTVTIDRIEKVKSKDNFDLIVYAEYKDPKPNELVAQVITYPTVIVKTELNKLPNKIKLETEYID
ncbi:protease complex subunit PrcB family protein [Caloranaerobacter ferrireducens]|uniref:protease complex subunit PrcB family protein n=1 Tax=Caloranaerobacter ferrireducens TaxID=1323370 RepID=UPI00084DA099|nr:protease complex subunit PrcB family protein [Caloranaerobacter ferrireducens]